MTRHFLIQITLLVLKMYILNNTTLTSEEVDILILILTTLCQYLRAKLHSNAFSIASFDATRKMLSAFVSLLTDCFVKFTEQVCIGLWSITYTLYILQLPHVSSRSNRSKALLLLYVFVVLTANTPSMLQHHQE